jgi:hypothetical protein
MSIFSLRTLLLPLLLLLCNKLIFNLAIVNQFLPSLSPVQVEFGGALKV